MENGHEWKDTIEQLWKIYADDTAFVDAGLITDRNMARDAVAQLYVRYMIISNELTVQHDSIIQPQIRDFIKEMLMCIYGRILELKQMLIDEDLSIYTPIIRQLINIRVTYDQFELKIPRYFRDERQSFLNEMDNKIDEINKRLTAEENSLNEMHEERIDNERSSSIIESVRMGTSDSVLDVAASTDNEQHAPQKLIDITDNDILEGLAIELIQKHIRAASDRVAVNELLADKINRENIISGKYTPSSEEESQAAAIKIQRYWRFFRIMRRTKVRAQRRKILIGLQMSNVRPNFNAQRELDVDEIRKKQNIAAEEYRNIKNKLQEKFDQRKKYEIIEEIDDELRAYIWTYFETCKHLPTWPDPTPIMFTSNEILGLPPITLSTELLKELNIPDNYYMPASSQRVPLGGSAIFLTGRWMSIEMAEILAKIIMEFENKPVKERKTLKNEFAKTNKIEQERIKQLEINLREQKRNLGVVPEPSDLSGRFNNMFDEYDSNWKIYNALNDQPREDLIKTEIYAKAHLELRTLVDEVIKIELERLKMALARDLKKKYKAPKEKTIMPVTRKGINKTKNLPNPEEIFENLVRNGMIKKSVISKFDDFEGEISYSGSALRGEPYYSDPLYGLGDIRQIIKELCVIGLIFSELRTFKQIEFSLTLLIAGPEKSGKTMLTNAICTETGSLKIELTLKNLSENYHDVKDINRLIDIIVLFVKTYQPVVIEVDLADVPFYKKVPYHYKLYKPSLMKKLLLKLIKAFEKTDRVIIIGKATTPWLTFKNDFTKVFQTTVFTVPDYNTIFMFLNNLLMSYPAISREFPVTPLAEMLAEYPRWAIAEIVSEIMTTERILKLRRSSLDAREFVPVMIKYHAHKYNKLREQYDDWYKSCTPLGIKKTLKIETNKDNSNKKKNNKKKNTFK